MNTLKYHEIIAKNKEFEEIYKNDNIYKILLISNIVVNQLTDFIEYSLRVKGVNAHIALGDFDNIAQGVINENDVDAFIIFWDIGNVTPNFFNRINFSTKEEISEIEKKLYLELDLVLKVTKSSKLLILNSFSSVMYDSNVIGSSEMQNLVKRLNKKLEISVKSNQLIINIDRIISELGIKNSINIDKFLVNKNLFKLDFFRIYSEKITYPILRTAGKYKKVLVLDCDNTLWGGIIGEDGLSGISLSLDEKPGIYFYAIQAKIKKLKNNGVLLAICSKNNYSEVLNVFTNHPDSILSVDDFVVIKCNWDNKVKNIIDISNEMNVGLDSLVFLDDSKFELELIAHELPEVNCYQVPNAIEDYIDVFSKIEDQFFDGRTLTSEDISKTEMYSAESKRKNLESNFSDIEDYLKFLDLKIRLKRARIDNIDRVSQLTLKTNQFNLTTIRYSVGEIEEILSNSLNEIFAIHVNDKYGDYGLTAVVILKTINKSVVYLDTFLMSCRIIGRNIEYKIFIEVCMHLSKKGHEILRSTYIPTAKNSQTANFYKKAGMNEVNSKNGILDYEIDLRDFEIPSKYNYIKAEYEL
jgi:FkbH-like protein